MSESNSGHKSIPQAILGGWTVQDAKARDGSFVAYPTLCRAAADPEQERPVATGRNATAIVTAINAVEDDMAAGHGADGESHVEPKYATLAAAKEGGWVVRAGPDAEGLVAYMDQEYADADPDGKLPNAVCEADGALLNDINDVERQMAGG